MVEIRVRSFPRVNTTWFAERAAVPSRAERLVSYQILFNQIQEKPSAEIEKRATVSPFTTLLIDLTSSEDALWESLRKRTRSYVKAAANLPHELAWFHADPDLRFFEFLTNFCAQKNVWIPSRSSYTRHIDSGVISSCVVDGEINVLHFYLVDRERARVRLLWSARALDGDATAYTARLNKLLHWEDLLYFKNELSMRTFDWGGVALTNEALSGVDEFKRGFGGLVVTEWNVIWRSPLYSSLYSSMKQSILRRSK